MITFDEVMDAALPLLPCDTTHVKYLGGKLRLYRSGDQYLSLELNGNDYSFHRYNSLDRFNDEISQMIFKQTMEYIAEHNKSIAPVELTLAEISKKLNIPVEQLRIKE